MTFSVSAIRRFVSSRPRYHRPSEDTGDYQLSLFNLGFRPDDTVLIHAPNGQTYGGFVREVNDDDDQLLIRFYDRQSQCWLSYWWDASVVQLIFAARVMS